MEIRNNIKIEKDTFKSQELEKKLNDLLNKRELEFEQYLIDSTFIDNTLTKVQDILSKDKLIPAIATHSFKYTEDGDKLLSTYA